MSRRLSIRLRLTFLYAAIVFVAGGILLGAAYVIVARNLAVYSQKVSATRDARSTPVLIPPQRGRALAELEAFLRKQRSRQAVVEHRARIDARNTVALEFLLALLALTFPAAALGYVIAGRVLGPVADITAMAQRAAAGDLSGRIQLSGPRDELHELARTFDAMLDRLESSFARRQVFVANASHELRTPLEIIRAELDATLTDASASEGELRAMARVISDATDRSEELIDRLLLLATSEQSAIQAEPIDLAGLVSLAVVDLERVIRETGIVLECVLDAARCCGDRILLTSLVRNLIENAARHNVAGGRLSARTGEAIGAAWMEIENDGAFIAEERLPELFEPFTRLRRIAGAAGGTGLGLAIVQAVAAAHDGRVVAMARPGGGLRVRFELPRPAAAADGLADDVVTLPFACDTRAAVSG
jgi:signal transduction histidine kinase